MPSASSGNEIPKDVEECDFYHGLLRREDLSYLLKEARHIVVRKKIKKDGVLKWYTFCIVRYSTVLELVNSYLSNKQPVNSKVSSSVLIRAIARQSWEVLHESIKVKDVLGEGQLGEVDGGSLVEVLTKMRLGQVDEDEKIANMSLGTARGFKYIQSQKCIHRDIAARNVLYTTSKVAKISDFGMSRKGVLYEMSKGTKKIPMKWTVPEIIAAYMLYTPKTDVYSFSILLWEVFSDGAEPYKGKIVIEVRRMLVTYIEALLSWESEVLQAPLKKDGVEEESVDNISSKKAPRRSVTRNTVAIKKGSSMRRRRRRRSPSKEPREYGHR